MGEVLERLLRSESAVAIDPSKGSEELAAMLTGFLNWLEMSRGMTLCQAFKPEFDWYMPTLINKAKLAHEFLGGHYPDRGPARSDEREHHD